MRRLFDLASRLEGVTRHASKHAAGIVISPEPISDMLPVFVPSKSTDLVTQYAMTELESLGFLKMDFLGLKNLTLIQRAVNLIKAQHGITLVLPKLPLDDPKTFALISRGETSGVFQLESSGLKDVLRRLQPAVFEDIIAVNALYRPGPLGSGMVDDFIERKHGRQPIRYIFAELEPILQETYGVIVYQEQVMKIATAIAGFSLGESDILRRAMGKKKAEEMAAQKSIFVEKSVKRNFDGKKAEELFDLMAYFAGYGFNKSHSAAYALIAYQTAYLKANFPSEFMACLISLEASNGEQMAQYVHEARDMKLTVLPPDINHSQVDFSVENGAIRFGLHGIKNVGKAALHDIIAERSKGLFKDMFDFCKRVDLRTCNKRVIESLICAGAFDVLPGNRAQKHDELPKILDQAFEKKKAEKTGQLGLFESAPTASNQLSEDLYVFQLLADWPDSIKLEKEKEVMGLYVSAQPLDTYSKHLTWIQALSFHEAAQKPAETSVICCGTITSHKVITTKKGDKMAFAQFEDYQSKAEVVIFPKLFAQIEPWLSSHTVFVIKGSVDASTSTKIKAQSCVPVDLLFESWACEKVVLCLPDPFEESVLQAIKTSFVPGTTPLEMQFRENNKLMTLKTKEKVRLDQACLSDIEKFNIKVRIYM